MYSNQKIAIFVLCANLIQIDCLYCTVCTMVCTDSYCTYRILCLCGHSLSSKGTLAQFTFLWRNTRSISEKTKHIFCWSQLANMKKENNRYCHSLFPSELPEVEGGDVWVKLLNTYLPPFLVFLLLQLDANLIEGELYNRLAC